MCLENNLERRNLGNEVVQQEHFPNIYENLNDNYYSPYFDEELCRACSMLIELESYITVFNQNQRLILSMLNEFSYFKIQFEEELITHEKEIRIMCYIQNKLSKCLVHWFIKI